MSASSIPTQTFPYPVFILYLRIKQNRLIGERLLISSSFYLYNPAIAQFLRHFPKISQKICPVLHSSFLAKRIYQALATFPEMLYVGKKANV